MGKVLVDDHDVEAIRFGRKIDVNGKEGTCYFSEEDNQVVKIYHMYLPRRKVYFENLSDNNISFPNDILFDMETGLIAGYTMDYLSGIKLLDGFSKKLEIQKLKKAYLVIREKLKEYNDIYMGDLVLENILFDYQRNIFKLIDTSRWYPCFDSYRENSKLLDGALAHALCYNHLYWLKENLGVSKELLKLYQAYQDYQFIPFLELLEMSEEEIKQKTGIKPDIIGDLSPKVYKKN